MAKLLLEYETIDVPMIDAVMENRESPPPMGWTQGGPGKDEPKPITIGGPAAQTWVAQHVMSRRPAPAPAFAFVPRSSVLLLTCHSLPPTRSPASAAWWNGAGDRTG